jgi:2-phosphoglycerate kinase
MPQKLPMIILIAGASHTGKTLLAQRMLEYYKYPYLSIDHLKMGLIRSGNTDLTPEDDDALTDYLWPIVREMIKTAVENHQNLVVEGCYVPFGWRKDFDACYLKYIRFICLAMASEYIESHFSDIIGHASDIETRMADEDCTIESLQADNRSIIDGFQLAGEPVTVIEEDYEKTIQLLLESQNGA